MATIKISALPPLTSAQLSDIAPYVQGGTTYRGTNAQLVTLFNAQLSFLPLAGGTLSGALNLGGFQINNVADPTLSTDAATKNYVDNIATGGGIPVVAASTGALTVTYSNGSAGVGATLTNAGSQVVFGLDGQSPTVGQRVLIKNQSSTFQNGVYTVTNVGSLSTNWILTRATDYDTPADINSTGVIPVTAGTANGNTGWYNSTTMVTIGTTAITFVQFGSSGTVTSITAGTGLSGGTITSSGTIAIATNGVTNALLAQMPADTLKGNNTGSPANSADLTTSQVYTLLGQMPAANLPSGTMFNFNQTQLTTAVSFTTLSFTIVSGLQVSITPTSASNKILVRAVISVGSDGTTNAYYKLNNGITDIALGTTAGSRISITAADSYFGAASLSTLVMEWLDTPATTSTLTYSVEVMQNGSGTGYINRSGTDTDTIAYPRSVSTISVCEVKA